MEKITCLKAEMLVTFIKNNTNISYPAINKLLRKKDIKVNGVRTNENIQLSVGDVVEIYISVQKIEIIYEDDNIVICNKPKGIETCDGAAKTLLSIVSDQLSTKLFAVHRLDLNTDGLVVFAKTIEAKNSLDDAFKNHRIEKHYLAEVVGKPKENAQKLVAYHKKDSEKALVYISDIQTQGFNKIITNYRVVENKGKSSILDVNIETGKTHQIRAHLAHIGHPVVGDNKYGNKQINEQFKKSKQQLCAYKLIFNNIKAPLEYLNGKTFSLK